MKANKTGEHDLHHIWILMCISWYLHFVVATPVCYRKLHWPVKFIIWPLHNETVLELEREFKSVFQQFQAVFMPTKYNVKSGDIFCRVCVDQHRYFKPTHHVFLPKPNQNISTALSQHIAENLTRGSFKVQHIANVFWRITGVSRVHPLGARKSLKDFVVIHPVEILSRKREK